MINPINKRFISLLLVIFLISCFATACQLTPEKEIVINKGDGRLEDIIASTNSPLPKSNISSQNIWVEDVLNDDGEIFLKIDASINVPISSELPVIKIEPNGFTQEQVDKIIAYFSGGNPIYSGDVPLAKDKIAEIIIKLESEYVKFKNGEEGFDDSITAESLKQQINNYKEMLATAPDTNEIGNTTLTTDPETMIEGLDLKIDMGRDELALFVVKNQGVHDYSSFLSFDNGHKYDDQRNLYGKDAENLHTTIQKAKEKGTASTQLFRFG